MVSDGQGKFSTVVKGIRLGRFLVVDKEIGEDMRAFGLSSLTLSYWSVMVKGSFM